MTVTPADVARRRDARRSFASMATTVNLRVVDPGPDVDRCLDAAESVFARIATSCTRFDPTSALMRANAAPRDWHEVPPELFAALHEAYEAYVATAGAFDPRVLRRLESWGYDRTLPRVDGAVSLDLPEAPADDLRQRPGRRRWRPRFDVGRSTVKIGRDPVDLGGIGKGLAVRWAADALLSSGRSYLVEAGGDLYAAGSGPDGTGWRVAVEDPHGGSDPVAVIEVYDQAVATSSIRVRSWRAGGKAAHHLIDPRTGAPADSGLRSVTVAGDDPARAEVWSKALFLAGRGRVRQLADDLGLAALLVDDDGVVGVSREMRPYVVWRGPHGL